MSKLTAELPRSSLRAVPLPPFSYLSLLPAVSTYASLSAVIALWTRARETGLDPALSPACSRALSRQLLDVCAEPYSAIAPFPAVTGRRSRMMARRRELPREDHVTTIPALFEKIQIPVQLLGPFVANETPFFTVLARLCSFVMAQNGAEFAPTRKIVESLYETVLIPAVSLGSPNPSIHHEIWRGFQHLSQRGRFAVYATWDSPRWAENADILFSLKRNYVGILYYLRRLAAVNVDEMTKILTYFGYATPVYLFRLLLHNCSTFGNLIPLIVPKLKCLSALCVDVGSFCVIEFFQNRQKKMEEDAITFDAGYTLATEFASNFIKLFSERVDCTVLFSYLANRIQSQDLPSLLILDKLLSSVAMVLQIFLSHIDPIASSTFVTCGVDHHREVDCRVDHFISRYDATYPTRNVFQASRATHPLHLPEGGDPRHDVASPANHRRNDLGGRVRGCASRWHSI